MSTWTKNNAAHRFLWIFVRSEHFDFATKGEQMTTFTEGGEWINNFVIGAAKGDSQPMIKNKATIFSAKFNSWIINLQHAEYEQGIKPEIAIAKLAESFASPGSKVKDCGDVVDDIFMCQGE